jgi:hypothetical protein
MHYKLPQEIYAQEREGKSKSITSEYELRTSFNQAFEKQSSEEL